MKNVTISINATSFPSQLVTDAEKVSKEFGLQIGQSIQYEWFLKDGSSCRYYSQWRDFRRLRLYARGEQSIAKYKNEVWWKEEDYPGNPRFDFNKLIE